MLKAGKCNIKKNKYPIKLWVLSFLAFAAVASFSFFHHRQYLIKMAIFNTFSLEQAIGIEDIYVKNYRFGSNLFLAIIETEKNWWSEIKVGKYSNGKIKWLVFSNVPVEQSILKANFLFGKDFFEPTIEVYGETHAGHGNMYIYQVVNDSLKLVLKTPAVDINKDVRWAPENYYKYGYGNCGEVIRGGNLLSSYKDVNNDGSLEIILTGTEDVICENWYDDIPSDGKNEEFKVASNQIYKIFSLNENIDGTSI